MSELPKNKTETATEHSLIAYWCFARVEVRKMPQWKQRFLLAHIESGAISADNSVEAVEKAAGSHPQESLKFG